MNDPSSKLGEGSLPGGDGTRAKRFGITMIGVLLVSAVTVSCSCPLLSVLSPSPTVTPTPTKTPRPSETATAIWSPTPPPTNTATVTVAPVETATVAPIDTPTSVPVPPTPTRRVPTATATRRPATPTPRPPAATATAAYQYSLDRPVEYLPDCAATTLEGTVWDADRVNQVAGVLLRVCIEGEYWCGLLRTGEDPDKGAGYYVATLDPDGPKAGNWFVAVVDAQGRPLSPAVRFQTDTEDCDPEGTGRQWVYVDFKKN